MLSKRRRYHKYKGLEIFRRAFEPRVQQCFDSRQSGKVDARLVMLIEYASNDPSKMRIQKYDKWIFDSVFERQRGRAKGGITEKGPSATRIGNGQTRTEHAVLVVGTLEKSALEQSQSELEREIASLELQIDALWEEIQQTILRYLLHNRNEKIANLKSRHEQTLKNLQSIDSFRMVSISVGTFHDGCIGSRHRSTR